MQALECSQERRRLGYSQQERHDQGEIALYDGSVPSQMELQHASRAVTLGPMLRSQPPRERDFDGPDAQPSLSQFRRYPAGSSEAARRKLPGLAVNGKQLLPKISGPSDTDETIAGVRDHQLVDGGFKFRLDRLQGGSPRDLSIAPLMSAASIHDRRGAVADAASSAAAASSFAEAPNLQNTDWDDIPVLRGETVKLIPSLSCNRLFNDASYKAGQISSISSLQPPTAAVSPTRACSGVPLVVTRVPSSRRLQQLQRSPSAPVLAHLSIPSVPTLGPIRGSQHERHGISSDISYGVPSASWTRARVGLIEWSDGLDWLVDEEPSDEAEGAVQPSAVTSVPQLPQLPPSFVSDARSVVGSIAAGDVSCSARSTVFSLQSPKVNENALSNASKSCSSSNHCVSLLLQRVSQGLPEHICWSRHGALPESDDGIDHAFGQPFQLRSAVFDGDELSACIMPHPTSTDGAQRDGVGRLGSDDAPPLHLVVDMPFSDGARRQRIPTRDLALLSPSQHRVPPSPPSTYSQLRHHQQRVVPLARNHVGPDSSIMSTLAVPGRLSLQRVVPRDTPLISNAHPLRPGSIGVHASDVVSLAGIRGLATVYRNDPQSRTRAALQHASQAQDAVLPAKLRVLDDAYDFDSIRSPYLSWMDSHHFRRGVTSPVSGSYGSALQHPARKIGVVASAASTSAAADDLWRVLFDDS